MKVIQRALELGINFIDTAPWYGDGRSEEVLGQVGSVKGTSNCLAEFQNLLELTLKFS